MCPRCKGISNIFLSPLIYVFAVIAIAAGVLIYFFQKFVTDSLDFMTPIQVLIPFLAFFILSLFMVYFEKPVIKKVRKTPDGRYFDQNGNELKMKMGKLVAASSQAGVPDLTSSAALRNSNDMTGRQPPVRRAPAPRVVEEPVIPDEKYFTNSGISDNDDLYAATAEKLGRDYTREVDISKTVMMDQTAENPVQRPAAPVQRTAQAPVRQTAPAPVQRPAQRPAAPAQRAVQEQRPAQAPVRQAAPIKEAAPAQRPAAAPVQRAVPQQNPAQRPHKEEALPVGKVAQERNTQKETKSGFEDLIAEYERLANSDTSEIPVRRVRGEREKPDAGRKGGGFRQL